MSNNCSKCGSNINEGERFCRSCGAEVIVNITQQSNQSDATHQESGNVNQNIPSQINNNIYNDEMLLKTYIGKNYEKIMKGGFSFCAFFFGAIYLLYRKMYLYGIALWVICAIAAAFLSEYSLIISLGFSIFLGIKFKEFYIKQAKEQVQKIKQENPGLSSEELNIKCSKKGGRNIAIVIVFSIIAFLFFVLVILITVGIIFSSLFAGNKLVCKSPEGNITITYNDDTITGYTANGIDYDLDEQQKVAYQIGVEKYIKDFSLWFSTNTSGTCQTKESSTENNTNNNTTTGEISITIPDGFKAGVSNTDDYQYYSYYKDLETCTLSVSSYQNYNNETAKKILEDNTKDYNIKTNIVTKNIKNYNWETITLTVSDTPKYMYIIEHNEKIYDVTFTSYQTASSFCNDAHNIIVNSLDFK